MLLPEDPNRRPELWDSVAVQLAKNKTCHVIREGIGNPNPEAFLLGRDEVASLIDKLRKAPVCRVSANRGSAVGPYVAGVRERDTVSITEFIVHPSGEALASDVGHLRQDLESMAINLLYADDNASRIMVPLRLEPWSMKDADVSSTLQGLMFEKKGR